MIFEVLTNSTEQTEEQGRLLAKACENSGYSKLFIALYGEMGVGKTAFTRGFASHFGIKSVKSPTYTVVNEYRGRKNIYHFDLYRITDGDDLYSIGYDDIIESEGYSIAEWSENIEDYLPEERVTVTVSRISNEGDNTEKRLIRYDIPYIKAVNNKIENIGF